MRARCFRCQNTFDTERFGTQTCPSCGSEIYLPDPSAPPPPAAGPQPETPPPPAGAAGWGPPPPGWTAPPGPPPGWAPLPPGAVPPPAEQSAPFAERAQRGFVPAFVETWKLAAVEPARFFRQVRVSETGSAVLFGVIAFTIGTWVSLVFRYLTASAAMGFMAQVTRRMGGRVETLPLLQMMQGVTIGSFIAQVIATPLIGVIAVYLTAAVFHLLLLLVRGAPRGFDASLTVVGYAYGIFLLEALPVCGGLVAVVWFVVAAIQGLAEAQRSGTGKAALAVLGPILLVCLCACAAGAILGIAGVSGLGGGMGGTPPSTGI